jgi:glycosyltransferase involved in cell wall biosynthesis/LmbE family N-acetylglucosaminyl deacetylase
MQAAADIPGPHAAAGAPRAAARPRWRRFASRVRLRAEAVGFSWYRTALYSRARPVGAEFASRPCLVVAPHPDDEVLGCGLAIAAKARAGAPVRVLIVTDGRHSHRSALLSPDQLIALRRRESLEACARLGLAPDQVRFLDFEDGAVVRSWDAICAAIAEEISRFAPADVLSPSPIDRHPDHRALGSMLRQIIAAAPRPPRLLEYPVWFFTARAWATWSTAYRLLYAPAFELLRLRPLLLEAPELAATKSHALAAHRTQTTNFTGEADWGVLNPRFLRHFLSGREAYFERSAPASASSPAPIRILHTLPDLAIGGGQHLLLRNIRSLEGWRVEHHVACIRPGGELLADFQDAGIPVHGLQVRHALQVPLAACRLARLVRQHRIDIIHTNNTGIDRVAGQLAALLTGRPVVNTLHSDFEPPPRGPGVRGRALAALHRVRALMERTLARLTVRHAIAVSDRARNSWSPAHRRLGPQGDISVIYPGIETRAVPPQPAQLESLRRELGLHDASPVLVCIGRLAPGKGQRLLIPALGDIRAQHAHARLLLVGDGPDRRHLEDAARQAGLGDAVVFAGPRPDAARLLDLADLVFCPSYSEGFGLTLLEALAAGKPIVASRLPSFEEILGPSGAAELVPPGDPAAIAAAALSLLANPARRAGLAAAGPSLVRDRFDQARSAARLAEVYTRLAAPRRGTITSRAR